MSKRKTANIGVSPALNLMLTKYATEMGISKKDAADRVFSILYPNGVGDRSSLAPTPAMVAKEEGAEALPAPALPEDDDVGKVLTETAKNLGTIKTIRALSSDLEGGDKGEKERISAADAFELRKIEAMFPGSRNPGGGSDVLDATFRKYIEPLQTEITTLRSQIHTQQVSTAEKDRDYYKTRFEEKEAREQRIEEMNAFLVPIREQFAGIDTKISNLAVNMTPQEGPKSDELKAIELLAADIKTAIQTISKGGGGEGSPTDQLATTLDSLGVLLEKMESVYGKYRGEGGEEFDWKAAGISTIGEITKEAITAFKETHTTVPWAGEPGEAEKGEQEQLSKRIVERKVYNYAMKEIQEGNLQLDPYAAGKALNLTPNQVWWAIDNLQKRGLLAAGPASAATKDKTGTLEMPLDAEGKPLVEGI